MSQAVEFRNPPVVETVLGVQFGRLPGLTNAHLGSFWERMRAEWPKVNDAPSLEDQYETFGEPPTWRAGVRFKLTQEPSSRLQARNATEDRMIQVQNCRIDYNWLKGLDHVYPRWRTVRPEFDKYLTRFVAFLGESGFDEPVPNQWEVTYVNHMPRGTVWQTSDEWMTIFNGLPSIATRPLGTKLEAFGGHWHFEIGQEQGRLHVEIQYGFLGKPEHGHEGIQMKLTARGPIGKEGDGAKDVNEGLRLGHDTIVNSFRDLTSARAHEFWNRGQEP